MPKTIIILNDRQICWLLSKLDEEIDYFKNLPDPDPEDKEVQASLEQLETHVENTLKRSKG